MLKYVKYLILLNKLKRRYNYIIFKTLPMVFTDFSWLGAKIYIKYRNELFHIDNAVKRIKKLRREWKIKN
jgi:hypothetical protein